MNKNGFISTAMAYTFLIVFAFLLLTIIRSYNSNVTLGDEIKNKAKDDLINSYTYFTAGRCQTYNAPSQGSYRIELWGADGGSANNGLIQGGHGAYTAGTISLNSGDTLYFCIGKKAAGTTGGFNGGGNGASSSMGGGGATDVRLSSGNWNDATGLSNRIMVAAGGGGASYASNTANGVGGNAGGLTGSSGFKGKTFDTTECSAVAGSQIGGGTFGLGTNGTSNAAGGGGGYYGGNGSSSTSCGAAGGSSYISGHLGSNAIKSTSDTASKCSVANANTDITDINCSIHFSGKYFVDTKMGYVTNKTSVPVPVYEPGSNPTYGDGSARIYKVS